MHELEQKEPKTFTITKSTVVRRRKAVNKYAGYKSFVCIISSFLVVIILISALMFTLRYFGESKEKTVTENLLGQNFSKPLEQSTSPEESSSTTKETIFFSTHAKQSQWEEKETTVSITNTDYLFKSVPNNYTLLFPVPYEEISTKLPESKTTTDSTSSVSSDETSSSTLTTSSDDKSISAVTGSVNPSVNSITKYAVSNIPTSNQSLFDSDSKLTSSTPDVLNSYISALPNRSISVEPPATNSNQAGSFGIGSNLNKIVNKTIPELANSSLSPSSNLSDAIVSSVSKIENPDNHLIQIDPRFGQVVNETVVGKVNSSLSSLGSAAVPSGRSLLHLTVPVGLNSSLNSLPYVSAPKISPPKLAQTSVPKLGSSNQGLFGFGSRLDQIVNKTVSTAQGAVNSSLSSLPSLSVPKISASSLFQPTAPKLGSSNQGLFGFSSKLGQIVNNKVLTAHGTVNSSLSALPNLSVPKISASSMFHSSAPKLGSSNQGLLGFGSKLGQIVNKTVSTGQGVINSSLSALPSFSVPKISAPSLFQSSAPKLGSSNQGLLGFGSKLGQIVNKTVSSGQGAINSSLSALPSFSVPKISAPSLFQSSASNSGSSSQGLFGFGSKLGQIVNKTVSTGQGVINSSLSALPSFSVPKISASSMFQSSAPKSGSSSQGLFGFGSKLGQIVNNTVSTARGAVNSSLSSFGNVAVPSGRSILGLTVPKQSASSGSLFGFRSKPVNKQIPGFSGLSIRTVNSPPVCLEAVCKRAVSSMMAIKSHADELDYCGDYYAAVCQRPEENQEKLFFQNNFRKILKTINTMSSSSPLKYFNSFYKQCIDYGNSINRINRITAMKDIVDFKIEDAIINSILTQSMPFFDVGVNIFNDKFIFEVTLPGLNYLKTNIKGWSLSEEFKGSCIEEIREGIFQNSIELDSLSIRIDDCIVDQISRYLNGFIKELTTLSQLPSMSFLEEILDKYYDLQMGDCKADLTEVLRQVQASWTIYRRARNPSLKLRLVSIKDLINRYDLDINWIEVFQGLTNSRINEDTKVYFSQYLEPVFKMMVNKKNNLKVMLDLWYKVQYYRNVVIEKQSTDRSLYCMDLVTQLMPEVSSILLSSLNEDRNELYDLVEGLLRDLKRALEETLRMSNFSAESVEIIEERLNQIRIARPNLNSKLSNVTLFNYWSISGTYQDQLVQLLKHYKKMLYDQVSRDVTGEALLKYFVYAFDTVPKAFLPYKEIVYQPGFTDEMEKNLPYFIRLAKQGLPLAKELSKFFIKNDFKPNLKPQDAAIFEEQYKNFDTKYLVARSKYEIEYIEHEVEDLSGKNFKFESVMSDTMAFNLVSYMYTREPGNIALPFIEDTPNKTFITIALQDFCKNNDLLEFIGDYYNMNLPAPIRVKNIAANSEFFSRTYQCSHSDKKQFPFVTIN